MPTTVRTAETSGLVPRVSLTRSAASDHHLQLRERSGDQRQVALEAAVAELSKACHVP